MHIQFLFNVCFSPDSLGCKISAKSLSVAGEEMVGFLRLKFGTLSKAFAAEDAISAGKLY